MLDYKDTAKGLVIAILSAAQDPIGIQDCKDIENGDKQKLLVHISALSNIFNRAITELQEEMLDNGEQETDR